MAAVAALRNTVDTTEPPYTDLKPYIIQLPKPWQLGQQTAIKSRVIKRHLGWYTTDSDNRQTEVILARLRTGHTQATHFTSSLDLQETFVPRVERAYP